jgi:hypothetical protein
LENGDILPESFIRDALLHRSVRNHRVIHLKYRQRAEVPENATEKRGVPPSADAVEVGEFDVGSDSFRFIVGGNVPVIHFGSSGERDVR